MGKDFRILHLKNGSYEQCIVKRNAVNRVLAMRLNGFFDKVNIIFFKADKDGRFDLSPGCSVSDISGFGPFFSKAGLKVIDSFLSEIRLIREARRLIKDNHINCITADEPFLTGLNSLILSFLTGRPAVIYNLADFELYYKTGGRRSMPYLPRAIERVIEKMVFKSAALVITDREFYRNYVIRRGALPERCKSTRTTTDPFYFSAAPDKDFKKDGAWAGKKILFYFGRLHPEKKTACLIRCLAKIKESRRDVILLMAGEGPHMPILKDLSRQLDVDKDVFFLGNKNNQELVNIMSVSDALLVTHAGYSLLEMALSGKPIIAFDYEWHSEFIENNVTGILVKDGDYHTMAGEVIKVLSDKGSSLDMGIRAKEKAVKFHHPEDAINDERACYEYLLGKTGDNH
jgi:glycosyltransferase involved in cell wall biosynthesis